jgi:hypothetical protein
MRTRLLLLILAGCFVHGPVAVQAQQVVMLPPRPLSNQDIVRMVRAKFDDATILKAIGTRKNSFDLSVDGMLRLNDFHFEKVAPRTYKVLLQNLASGEYGFLSPGAAASADLASRGKVYTFHVVE